MQFKFDHDTDTLVPFLLKAQQYIQDKLIPGNNEELLNKCKFIITEFCINGIKHSGERQSFFDIYLDNRRLVIEKKDHGSPFRPKAYNKQMTLPLAETVDTIILMEDDYNRLNMQRIDEYSVRFYVENIHSAHTYKQQVINEHFGLIIICCSSDSFIYRHHAHDGLNIFTASIQLL